jgi:tellurite resistance protein
MDVEQSLSPQDSLVALMIAVSAADETIRTVELVQIQSIVDNLPIFAGYDPERLSEMGRMVMALLAEEEGLDALFGLARRYLPERLWETAYAMACDVAAADGRVTEAEGRMLEEIREELAIDRLHAAAIERGARARYMTV